VDIDEEGVNHIKTCVILLNSCVSFTFYEKMLE